MSAMYEKHRNESPLENPTQSILTCCDGYTLTRWLSRLFCKTDWLTPQSKFIAHGDVEDENLRVNFQQNADFSG